MKLKQRVPETDHGLVGKELAEYFDNMLKTLRNNGFLNDKIDFINHANIVAGKVLEIGPGPGYVGLEWLKKNNNATIVGLEISPEMLEVANKNAQLYSLENRVEYIIGNALNMPFPDVVFDGVFSNSSLHEWSSPLKVLNEISRVLKRKGNFCIIDLRRDLDRLTIDFMKNHIDDLESKKGFMRSVQASYTSDEVYELLSDSDLNDYLITEFTFGIVVSGSK